MSIECSEQLHETLKSLRPRDFVAATTWHTGRPRELETPGDGLWLHGNCPLCGTSLALAVFRPTRPVALAVKKVARPRWAERRAA